MSRCVHRKTLNVGDGASFEEIRKAFRKLALVYHPDKSDILDAEEKFKKINTAYDYLKKRHDINSSDDFNTKNESFKSKKEPTRLEIKATFQDILRGSHVKVAGISGSVEIKPGSTEGTEYLVNSTGKIVKDSKLADYVLVLRITPHPHFERQFNDLIYQAEITSQDSKRGITLKIPTLDGNDLDLRVQNVDSLDSRCIPGRGFPLYHNPKFCGDLIVKFKIKTSIMKRSLPLTLEELFRGCAKFEEIPFQTVFKYGTKSSEVRSIGIVCLPGLVPGTVIKKDILPFDSSYLSIDPSCVEFTIEEIPHQLFTREKNDLKCTVSISTDDSEVRVPTIEGGHVTVKIPDVVTRTSVRRVVGYGMPCSTNSNIRGDLLVSFDFKSIKQQPSMNSSSDFDSKHLQTHYDLPLTLHEILFGCTKTMKVAVRVLDSKGKPKNEERDVNVRCKPGLSENFKINHCLYRPYENISPRNVYFIVKILPHQHFKVQNNDIVYVASISFWDTKVEVPTIKGDKMTVNVPKAVNENSTSRLLGRGLPFTVNSVNRRGDLIVKFNVEKVQVVEKDLFVSLEDLLKGCIKYRTFTSKTGRRREEAIVVKPGMKEGTRVRFSTKEQSNEVFIIKVKPHKLFTRSGSDLIYQASVSHRGATTSTLLEIPLLDGKDFLLRVTRIDSEQTREIPNQGLPLSINSSERGKMVVKFSICPPEHAVIVRELYITLEENLRGCTRTELIDTVDIEDGVESNNVQQFKVYLEPGVNHRTIIADSFYENYFHRTVHFVVNISPHKTFQRQGKKLVYSTKIKPQDKQIRVPTLQGGDIMFNIPKYSKDFVKVFKSRGLPFSDSSRYGDLVLYWSY